MTHYDTNHVFTVLVILTTNPKSEVSVCVWCAGVYGEVTRKTLIQKAKSQGCPRRSTLLVGQPCQHKQVSPAEILKFWFCAKVRKKITGECGNQGSQIESPSSSTCQMESLSNSLKTTNSFRSFCVKKLFCLFVVVFYLFDVIFVFLRLLCGSSYSDFLTRNINSHFKQRVWSRAPLTAQVLGLSRAHSPVLSCVSTRSSKCFSFFVKKRKDLKFTPDIIVSHYVYYEKHPSPISPTEFRQFFPLMLLVFGEMWHFWWSYRHTFHSDQYMHLHTHLDLVFEYVY